MKLNPQLLAMVVALCLVMPVGLDAQNVVGKVLRLEPISSKYVKPRNVDVWLPNNYDPATKYAVLYMHDGQALFDTLHSFNHQEWRVDETLSSLIARRAIPQCIVVGIWNTGPTRKAEYFPQKALANLSQDERAKCLTTLEGGPQADNYLKFIVEELKPHIDSRFSTWSDQKNTFIAGSSMGGLISMYAICEYPEIFGGAACLSTHWTGSYEDNNAIPQAIAKYLNEHLPPPVNHRIYFDYGTVALDSLYKPHQLNVDKIMARHGYTPKQWVTKEFVGENHSEEAWSKRFEIPVTFLLSPR
jgi:predicted alpha/beta superfamily hydrolase